MKAYKAKSWQHEITGFDGNAMKNKNMNLLQVNLVILFMDFMLKSIRNIIFIRKMIFMN